MIDTASRIDSRSAGPRSGRPDAPSLPPSARLLVGVALVPVAVLTVHEIRYVLAFGDASGAMLSARGHGYLGQLLPPLALICAVALGGFLARLGQAWQTGSGDRSPRLTLIALWLTAASGLLAIYSGQELLEALIGGGGPSGLDAVFGDGGLWALPASLLTGLLLALVLRGASRAVAFAARLGRRRRRPEAIVVTVGTARPPWTPALDPMALSAPGRAPPRAALPYFAGFSR